VNIGGIEKAGFYPYPPQATTQTCALLDTTAGARLRLLDPCAGEGVALAAVAHRLTGQGATVETYGVELSSTRAAQAARVLDHTITGDWFDVATRTGAYSLLWCNPPYDFDAVVDARQKTKRLEYTFLRSAYDRLAPGGVLVYIVPRWVLGLREVARLLAGYCADLTVWRIPEYDSYKQIVVLGVKRARAEPHPEAEAALQAWVDAMPPDLATATQRYLAPPAPVLSKFFFYTNTLSPTEVRDLAGRHGALTLTAWRQAQTRTTDLTFQPVAPMRRGHVAMLVASGLLGTLALGDVIAKGRAVKVLKRQDAPEGDATAAQAADAAIVERETFVTKVFTLDRQGVYQVIETNAGLETFLETHGAALARLIETRHKPLYTTPDKAAWQALDGLLPAKRLPGRPETGLLDAQRHVALAAAASIRKQGYAHVVAEMSFGKTPCALATAVTLAAWPALVICPTHLVAKWVREAGEIAPGCRAVVVDSVADVQALQATYRPGAQLLAIISKERAKLGSGWRPAAVKRSVTVTNDLGATGRVQGWACPRCGAVVADEDGVPVLDLGKKRLTCGPCGEPLYQYTRFNVAGAARWPVARYIRQHARGFFRLLIADEVHHYKGKATDQASAFQDLVGACRWTLTLTGTIFGGKSTSLFWLTYRLDGQVRRDFAFHDEGRWAARYGRLEKITRKESSDADAAFSGRRRYYERAKEIPGISPRIVERVLPGMIFARLSDLGYALPPVSEQIIRLALTQPQAAQYVWLDTTLTNLYREAKAKGDVGLLSVWLQNVLARPNSCFREERVVRGLSQGSRRISVPVAALQGGVHQPIVLPPVVGAEAWLPKEAWLASFCQAETAQRRKTLVYLRQTGTRDIQPRLAQALQAASLRALILPDSVAARQREAWIADHAADLDVLLVNPRKVETGLDLVAFATVVFYEIEYSLASFWQAMRRVWRLGQTQPVKIAYAVYQNTLEEAGLALLGQKLRAAQLLYGDDASSAIADAADDDGDFLAELAARVLARENLTTDGLTGLVSDHRTTAALWGSPTQSSPQLSWVAAYLARKGLTHEAIIKPARRRPYLPGLDQGRLFD
jgi:SAM-dependent methyltransferase/ribosomal protein S27AE